MLINQEIDKFNQDIHVFENECLSQIKGFLDIFVAMGFANEVDELQEYLQGIRLAKTMYQVSVYKRSLIKKLGMLHINNDILEINKVCNHFNDILNHTDTSFIHLLDVAKNKKMQADAHWISIAINEFNKHADSLISEIKGKIEVDNDLQDSATETLTIGLQKISVLKNHIWQAQEQLKKLYVISDAQEFESKRKQLFSQIASIQELGNLKRENQLLKKFVLIAARSVDAYSEARLSYLPEPTNTFSKAMNFGWIAAGVALAIVAVVFEAPLIVLALGFAGIVYGCVDLAKEIAEPKSEATTHKLGPHIEKTSKKSILSNPLKLIKKTAPVLLSALALTAAVIALVNPITAIPMLVVGLMISAVAGSFYAYKLYREKSKEKLIDKGHAIIQNKFAKNVDTKGDKNTLKNTISLKDTAEIKLSSEAKIDMLLFGKKTEQKPTVEEIKNLKENLDKLAKPAEVVKNDKESVIFQIEKTLEAKYSLEKTIEKPLPQIQKEQKEKDGEGEKGSVLQLRE